MLLRLTRLCYTSWWYEACRHAASVSKSAGRAARTCHLDCPQGNVPSTGGSCLWGVSTVCQRLASMLSRKRDSGIAVASARTTLRHSIGSLAGRYDRPFDYRPLSGPTQAAICPLDARSGSGSHHQPIRHPAFRLDGRALPQALGLHAPKTPEAGIRAGPQGGAAMADEEVSGHQDLRKTRGRNDLLGRRDGDAVRPSSRHFLRAAWKDTGHPRDWKTFPLQHDLRYHQPRQDGIHGIRREFHDLRIYCVPEAADPSCWTKSLSHYRRASSTYGSPTRTMVGAPAGADSPLFSARLQPGSQSGRVAQSRCQDKRSWPKASTQQDGDGGKREELLVEYPTPPQKGEGLFPALQSPLRRIRCETFSAPLNKPHYSNWGVDVQPYLQAKLRLP